ncbi:hypothetical protein B4589_006995 [Halolamina sp. CBA1230]|uniref:hypothetical protein n=1 Tax=Halolamina sp. CBA1230 TaxID=1853690 RepID=UPI0009A13DC6|nr:hypothetical protein [Halolamina sp. CBA1230]QKY20135.1 hypothetical protein B4589_006995 [Halolamina sp. CBA1230]
MADEPVVYDHFQLTDGEDAGCLFRVVGVDTGDDRVTLLRVTDADGNREATGDLRHVSHDRLDRAFTPADNPDPRFESADYVAGLLLLGGVALAVHPAGDRVAGAILAVGGGYLLWRRH